jgi:hypothetical protein
LRQVDGVSDAEALAVSFRDEFNLSIIVIEACGVYALALHDGVSTGKTSF